MGVKFSMNARVRYIQNFSHKSLKERGYLEDLDTDERLKIGIDLKEMVSDVLEWSYMAQDQWQAFVNTLMKF